MSWTFSRFFCFNVFSWRILFNWRREKSSDARENRDDKLPVNWSDRNRRRYQSTIIRVLDGRRLCGYWCMKVIIRLIRLCVDWKGCWFDRYNRWMCDRNNFEWRWEFYLYLHKHELKHRSDQWISVSGPNEMSARHRLSLEELTWHLATEDTENV